MKNYNRIILCSILFYLLASTAGAGILKITEKQDKSYKVEINRLYSRLTQGISPDRLEPADGLVQDITFLPASEIESREAADRFYQERNGRNTEILPLFEEGRFTGMLRFDYEQPAQKTGRIFLYMELILTLMEAALLAVLFYIKYRLLRPFSRMCELPRELSKGHLNMIVKEEKNQYFDRFIKGIGQLKDTLEVTKRRELELEKEKKKLLLSLSHDIKTPLNTLKLYGKALEENLFQEEAQKTYAAAQIGAKAEEIENYVEQIMTNTREDLFNIQVQKGEFYLSELMKKVLGTYREKCRIRMTGLQVAAYENRLLNGDMERTAEVFENIFENAFKYGDGRKIEITFYEEDYCQLIRIYNSGIPVTDNEFNHIFESFFRGVNSEGIPGNGLGLYICREIMRKMEGDIFAQKEEEGMAFVLVLRLS